MILRYDKSKRMHAYKHEKVESIIKVNKMPINQLETNLQAITTTIAFLEKKSNCDPDLLNELKKERDRLLKELNVHSEI